MICFILLRIRLDEAADAMRDNIVELCKVEIVIVTLAQFRATQIDLRKLEGVWQ